MNAALSLAFAAGVGVFLCPQSVVDSGGLVSSGKKAASVYAVLIRSRGVVFRKTSKKSMQ